MKTSAMFFAIAVLTLTLGCGNVLAKENGKQPSACEKKFSELDSTHRGYLVPDTFRRELEGSPNKNRKILPYGKVRDEFAAADKNGDGIVTPKEFCAWDPNGG